MKKTLAIILALVMLIGILAGCTAKAPDEPNEPADTTEEKLKIALVLPGSINDQGWCTSAYVGLQNIEATYGCEISYVENVTNSSYEEAFRNFANSGYDVIFGHGSQFFDSAELVSKDYPGVHFVINSTNEFAEPNVASLNTLPEEMGILAGVAAAYATKSGKIGMVLGETMVSGIVAVNAAVGSALMAKPDLQVLTNATGSNTDAAKCKEVTQAMIDQGADVIFYDADAAGLGALEACQENDVLAIPAIVDQSELAPETVLVSCCNSYTQAMTAVVGYVIDGTFQGQFYPMGCNVGCVYYATNEPVWNAVMTDEGKAAVQDAFDKLASGEWNAMDIIDQYVPENIKVS